MTQQQFTLSIDVVGISLWVKREDCIDVLFPLDIYALGSAQHHRVTLDVGVGMPAPIDGLVIDLRSLADRAVDNAVPIFAADGWVEEPLSMAAPARNIDAAYDTINCVAALRLPFGNIVPIPNQPDPMGPFIYGAQKSLFLTHGKRWRRTFTGDAEVTAEFFNQTTRVGVRQPFGSAANQAGAFALRFDCLSRRDRAHPNESIAPGGLITDYTMLGVLTQDSRKPLKEAPQYAGPSTAPMAPSISAFDTNPRKPCPPAWADPAH